jgi:hypothetical protein
MTNLPMPRPRWAIVATAHNEIECQRMRQWLERRGITVRVQSVILAKNREVGPQLKIFVPSGDLHRAQTIIKEKHSYGKTFMADGQPWLQLKENGRLFIIIAIIIALAFGSLLMKIWY